MNPEDPREESNSEESGMETRPDIRLPTPKPKPHQTKSFGSETRVFPAKKAPPPPTSPAPDTETGLPATEQAIPVVKPGLPQTEQAIPVVKPSPPADQSAPAVARPAPPPTTNMVQGGFAELTDEEPLPSLLRPDAVGAQDTVVDEIREAGESKKPRPLRALLVGCGLGLLAGILLWFQGWTFQSAWPEIEAPAKMNMNFPKEMKWLAGGPDLFFGLDANDNLWQSDLRTTSSRFVALAKAPDAIPSGKFSLVSRPPLEQSVTLAWIESLNESSSSTLRVQSSESSLAAVVPIASYPYPPTAIDHPDPQVGLILVTVDHQGNLKAWQSAENPMPLLWQGKSSVGWPVHGPLTEPSLKDKQAAIWLIIIGEKGIQVFDAANGAAKGVLELRAQFARPPVVTYAALNRLWMASDGKRLEVFQITDQGEPQSISSKAFSEIGKPPDDDFAGTVSLPRLLALSHSVKNPEYAVVAPDGRGLLVNKKKNFKLPGDALPSRPVAAIDLNGDGVPDLAGLRKNGSPWFIDGTRPESANSETKAPGQIVNVDPDAPVLWDLAWKADDRQSTQTMLKATFCSEEGEVWSVQARLRNSIDLEDAKYYLSVSNDAGYSNSAK